MLRIRRLWSCNHPATIAPIGSWSLVSHPVVDTRFAQPGVDRSGAGLPANSLGELVKVYAPFRKPLEDHAVALRRFSGRSKHTNKLSALGAVLVAYRGKYDLLFASPKPAEPPS